MAQFVRDGQYLLREIVACFQRSDLGLGKVDRRRGRMQHVLQTLVRRGSRLHAQVAHQFVLQLRRQIRKQIRVYIEVFRRHGMYQGTQLCLGGEANVFSVRRTQCIRWHGWQLVRILGHNILDRCRIHFVMKNSPWLKSFRPRKSSLPHLCSQQLFRRSHVRFSRRRAPLLALHQCSSLLLRRTAIKHKHRLDAVVEQLENAPQESKEMRVRHRPPIPITHRHLEMIQPDRRIDR